MTQVIDTLTPAERDAFNHVHKRHMAHHRYAVREIARHRGVAMAGMAPEPYELPSTEEMLVEAREMARRMEAHKQSHNHQARVQNVQLGKLIQAMSLALMEHDAALSRQDGSCARKANAVRDIATEIMAGCISLEFHSIGEATDLMSAEIGQ